MGKRIPKGKRVPWGFRSTPFGLRRLPATQPKALAHRGSVRFIGGK